AFMRRLGIRRLETDGLCLELDAPPALPRIEPTAPKLTKEEREKRAKAEYERTLFHSVGG
ncbi:MAG: hypothetical protein ACPG77_10720, partial [Nannocystaceae bacterium]